MTHRNLFVIAATLALLGAGFCTRAFLGSQEVSKDRREIDQMISDSVEVHRQSLLGFYRDAVNYNADVNGVIGGMHMVRGLRQDSTVLPQLPIAQQVVEGPLRRFIQDWLGETVWFRWQTNEGEYVAVAIPKAKVRLRYDRTSTANAVFFRIPPIAPDRTQEMDFRRLTQRDYQQLINDHVDEAVFICPDTTTLAPPSSREVC